ncbi:hypothetical protein SAMN04488020_11122 [Palleronia marisminoris]|uniref:Uncharacterized protein n=1 Tax=Palleronia marisminoris TaxID=315423 RepID=A0A1Y5TF14_9RHOB|nr:hypothetical protein SAMN04488020_11122 [Palleronia marisminoris]SLN62374.1 hypothetical protein PAM7066_03097 [Palleronia marisminoris]
MGLCDRFSAAAEFFCPFFDTLAILPSNPRNWQQLTCELGVIRRGQFGLDADLRRRGEASNPHLDPDNQSLSRGTADTSSK